MCACGAEERENASCESSYSDSFDDDDDSDDSCGGGGLVVRHSSYFKSSESGEISDVMAVVCENEEGMEELFYDKPISSSNRSLLELSEDQMVRQLILIIRVVMLGLRWPWLYHNH